MPRFKLIHLIQLLVLLPLCVGMNARAFELIELKIEIVVLDAQTPVFSYDFETGNTGFSVFSPNAKTLELKYGYSPFIGKLPEDNLQQGFVLLDGTLQLEAEVTDAGDGRENIRNTYRMNIDENLVRRNQPFLRNLYVRRGLFSDESSARAARATQITDARMMRFVEFDSGGRWVRAVRMIDNQARADIRYMPRMSPDNVLGHYGYDTKDGGESYYVWAVVDKNSRYAVGINVDNDDDGVFNSDDNCLDTANSEQADQDEDGSGDACDADVDNDGVSDNDDNCPLVANAGQGDADRDGVGDICDADDDNDSVIDGADFCPYTPENHLVNGDGCAIEDLCPCENGSGWKNHGAYVNCVARTTVDFQREGLISRSDELTIARDAAQSSCGRKG